MTKPKGVFKKRKGPCVMKRWANVRPIVVEAASQTPQNSPDSNPNLVSTTSSSRSKLGDYHEQYNKYSSNFQYSIVDLNQFEQSLQNIAQCNKCSGELSIQKTQLVGLAEKISIICTVCSENEQFVNSKCTNYKNTVLYDVNLRLVYGLRNIGKGKTAAKLLCGIMNLCNPPHKFFLHENCLLTVVERVCKDNMKLAIEEAVEENDNCRDLAVALDGSWQKRGHTSLNGIVSATSVSTGKVVDVEIISKYCQCKDRYKNKHEDSCSANFFGTSGGMEVFGAMEIFRRSLPEYNVRYLKYLGDGDSRAYTKVNEDKPYGDEISIDKIECIGHVRKRMGTRLRSLKTKTPLLSQRRRGGLTNEAIDKIQKYYGLAIQRTAGESIQVMKQEIWSVYFHISASNHDTQKHGLCTSDPDRIWCKYLKAQLEGKNYDHTKHFHLPSEIMSAIKPVFQDLTNNSLLEKCSLGKTQNPNESFNNSVWTILPKRTFVGMNTLKFGVYQAVNNFNIGNIAKCEVLNYLQLDPGEHMLTAMEALDSDRVRQSDHYFKVLSDKIKTKRSLARKRMEDRYEEAEDPDNPSYAPGNY